MSLLLGFLLTFGLLLTGALSNAAAAALAVTEAALAQATLEAAMASQAATSAAAASAAPPRFVFKLKRVLQLWVLSYTPFYEFSRDFVRGRSCHAGRR